MSIVVDVDGDFEGHVFYLLAFEAVLEGQQFGRLCRLVGWSRVRSHAVAELVGAADDLACRGRGTCAMAVRRWVEAALICELVEQFVRVMHYVDHFCGVCEGR